MTDETTLKNILIERISVNGHITFADFMSACLYEPGLGYYTSPGRKVGAEGDFYTSISVHAAFGRVIAREIAQMWRCMGTPAEFILAECGAGNGRLACDIMDYLAEREPLMYDGTTIMLVEREPSLESAQRDLLAGHIKKTRWLTPEAFTVDGFSFIGCIYSNELFDAMPVHRVIMTPDGLQEIYVTVKDDEFIEEHGEPSSPEISEYLKRVGIELHQGQQAEINLAAPAWLASAANSLQRGFILTIDYGFPAAELFAPHRIRGTLLCYHRHQTEENPYIRLGQQDITTHIDFTTLTECGEKHGLHREWFGEQYRFLMGAGIVEEIEEVERSDMSDEEKLKLRLALKKLIMPGGGMGDTFKVLIQSKKVAPVKLLCQRRIGV